MADLITSYDLDQRNRGLTAASRKAARYVVTSFDHWMGDRSVLEATKADIEDWLGTKDITARTRAWYVTMLAGFFRWAIREEHTDVDPTVRIVRPKLRRLLPRPISDADLRLALDCASPRVRCWLALGAYQGLRAAEIAALRREEVLEAHDPPLLVVANGKGGKSAVLPLNRDVELALQAFGLPRSGYIWRPEAPLSPKTVSKYVSAHLRGLGIEATLHQARHWFGSTIYRTTRDIRLCQELMRHASLQTTQAYVAWAPEAAAGAVRALTCRPAPLPGSLFDPYAAP